MATNNTFTHTINTDKIFLNNRNDKKTDHIVFETNGVLGENNVEFSNCNVDVKVGFMKAPDLRTSVIKDTNGNNALTLSGGNTLDFNVGVLDFNSATILNFPTLAANAVGSSNGYASLDAELDALTTGKVSTSGHTANRVFVSTGGGGITTSARSTTDLDKLQHISVTQAVDLDAMETKLAGITASATPTTTANVRSAGAVMDDEMTNLSALKSFNADTNNTLVSANTAKLTSSGITTLIEGATDSNVFTNSDHTKLNGITASATPTTTANVRSAGALMDDEMTDLAGVKALQVSNYSTAAQVGASLVQLILEYGLTLTGGASFDGDETNLRSLANQTALTNITYSSGITSIDNKVGIGTSSPKTLLHVEASTSYQTNDSGISSLDDLNSVSYLSEAENYSSTQSGLSVGRWFNFASGAYNLSIYSEGMIFSSTYIGASDIRIKKDITEIDDERSLIQLRNLPCVDYNYIDEFKNGEYKTIGFIAQQVKEHMPNCVKVVSDIIPNEMRTLENLEWEEISVEGKEGEPAKIHYKLINHGLEECEYRFYVKKDASSNEIRVSLDYPFLFKEKYEEIFCFGKRVDDFLAIDKNKIFAVAFSATQEIDKIQQKHIIEIANIKAELQKEKIDKIQQKHIIDIANIKAELQKEKNKTIYFEDKLRDIETTLKSLTN